ncbi:MAG: hypothetical protein HYV09_10530 [Deltaproteobacteria bacterium]|nr:hypothetical protein [Deltaproteobacteria bacterium]
MRVLPFALAFGIMLGSAAAAAGPIADENAKPGIDGGWPVRNDGTAAVAGVVDVYPGKWSIKPGETITLKVRSTTGYSVRVFRVGWYGGKGAHEVKKIEGLPADAQPYPVPEGDFGLAEARWKDSVSIPTDASWTPGVYVVRVERADGFEADTFFVVRDDLAKMPILALIATATHQAYNAWPGMKRSGKSLYDFNSAPGSPKGSLYAAAVKVSFDRPFLVGGGTADLGTQEYPAIRFLERNGWDVGFVTDQDVHEHPEVFKGRKAVLVLGHAEYWTHDMFDGAMAARDSGVNLMFMTGNTIGWQIRFEPGAGGPMSTEIGYKNSFVRDPEQKAAIAALNAGDIEGAKKHFRLVTRGFRQLEYRPEVGIDMRSPAMILTGVQSTAMMKTGFPWGDLEITNPTHWIFEGTGVKAGDRIKGVMGYEVDSTKKGDPTWDHFRPAGQIRLGTIRQTTDDSAQGSAGYYAKDLGGGRFAEVVALSAISFSWGLDGFAHGSSTPESDIAKKMVNNALARWTSTTPPKDPGSGLDEDKTGDPNGDRGGSDTDLGGAPGPSAPKSKGCTYAAAGGTSFALAAAGLSALSLARRRRRRRLG